jgi:hypothetical protein
MTNGSKLACERIVVFSKRDLLPEWGIKVRKTCISNYLIRLSNPFLRPAVIAFSDGNVSQISRTDLFLCQLAPPERHQIPERSADQ